MTSRERVQAVLSGNIPDRVPFNFWMDRDLMEKYDAKWGGDFRLTHYGVDVIEAFQGISWWPSLSAKTLNTGNTTWQLEPMVESLKEAVDLPMPDATDPAVYDGIRQVRAANPDKAIWAMQASPLDIIEPLRMAENLFYDIYDNPEDMHTILDHIKPVYTELARQTCALDIDVLYIAGDICGIDGPLISPKSLREFNFDYLRDAVEVAHEAGKKVFYHTDGYVMDIIDLFIEYGIDGINPIEHRYNAPVEVIKKTAGKLMVYGGLDNCNKIPNESPEGVRKHVREVFDVLGKSGSLILSSHDIPACCSQENLDAMVDEILHCTY